MPAVKTALLTLGRLPKALDIARALHHAGWRVIVAEPSRWHLCAVSRAVARSFRVASPVVSRADYHRDLLRIIRNEAVTLVVPVSEECLYVAELASEFPQDVRLLSQPLASVAQLHDKYAFAQRVRALGLSAPETALLSDPQANALLRTGGVVVKGRNSAAGIGLEFVEHGARLPGRAHPGRWVAQRRIDGELVSTFSIANAGRTAVTAIYRARIMSGTVAVCFERVTGMHAIEHWIEQFVRAEGHSGMIAFDFVIDADDIPWAIECNPRATSGIHFIRPSALGPLLTDPEHAGTDALRDELLLQQLFPALVEVQKSMFRNGFFDVFSAWRRARDVTFRWDDPLPLWTLPLTAWRIMAGALFGSKSFGEVAVADITWQPER